MASFKKFFLPVFHYLLPYSFFSLSQNIMEHSEEQCQTSSPFASSSRTNAISEARPTNVEHGKCFTGPAFGIINSGDRCIFREGGFDIIQVGSFCVFEGDFEGIISGNHNVFMGTVRDTRVEGNHNHFYGPIENVTFTSERNVLISTTDNHHDVPDVERPLLLNPEHLPRRLNQNMDNHDDSGVNDYNDHNQSSSSSTSTPLMMSEHDLDVMLRAQRKFVSTFKRKTPDDSFDDDDDDDNEKPPSARNRADFTEDEIDTVLMALSGENKEETIYPELADEIKQSELGVVSTLRARDTYTPSAPSVNTAGLTLDEECSICMEVPKNADLWEIRCVPETGVIHRHEAKFCTACMANVSLCPYCRCSHFTFSVSSNITKSPPSSSSLLPLVGMHNTKTE
jgi:hypothetical protein